MRRRSAVEVAGAVATLAFLAAMTTSSIPSRAAAAPFRPSSPCFAVLPPSERRAAAVAAHRRAAARIVVRRMSSVGGRPGDPPPPPGGGGGKLGDFLDGPDGDGTGNGGESENLRKARERLAEDSLPISFGMEPRERRSDDDEEEEVEDDDDATEEEGDGSILAGVGGTLSTTVSERGFEAPSDKLVASNPYLDVVSRLSPSDLISKFTASANPRVKEAVRSTVLGLIGSLPKMAFDTKTVATGAKLASLMFQLQMTGYMFKNAEYRLSLSESLGLGSRSRVGLGPGKSSLLLGGSLADEDDDEDDDEDSADTLKGEVQGKIKVRYDVPAPDDDVDADDEEEEEDDANRTGTRAERPSGMEVEVDASAYLSELRSEVSKLRDELSRTRQSKEETIRKDLLLYIRTLPPAQMKELTSTMTPDVLDAMKGLVNAVMAGIGEGQVGPGTVTEQSGEAMAQLCMWQLVVGYNLRELEVREEMRSSLMGSSNAGKGGDDDDDDGGGLLLEPGTLE